MAEPQRRMKAPQKAARRAAINLLKMRFALKKDRLLEAHVPLKEPSPSGKQLELNNALYDAFARNNEKEMLRLVKAGADPHSIERRIPRGAA